MMLIFSPQYHRTIPSSGAVVGHNFQDISDSCHVMNVQLNEVVWGKYYKFYMPVCGASLLNKGWAEVQLYLWRGSDRCVIVEDQWRDGNTVKSEKLKMHQEPPQRCR